MFYTKPSTPSSKNQPGWLLASVSVINSNSTIHINKPIFNPKFRLSNGGFALGGLVKKPIKKRKPLLTGASFFLWVWL
jgi:hypothetical protein